MTTEQETGRGAPVRRAVPRTGVRRPAVSQQPKPRPRPDVRAEARADVRSEAAGRRPAAERARLDARASGSAGAPARGRATGRATAAPVRGKAPAPERTKAPTRGRTAAPERGKPAAAATERRPGEPTGARVRKAPAARPAGGRGPARRQRTPFVLLVVGLLCGGLVSLLLLNTMLAQDTITDAKLREEIAVARRENEKIDQEYQLKTQPGNIARLAEMQGQHPDWDEVNAYTGDERPNQADTER
ncbi:hypothetical protein [Nonomuraea sp. NPDC049309]|uniref:hypothetical protein n=1 Tax=Nonomuraea sp. NPDC049309 TaxID=3364350 RepID=UPI00372328AD